MYLKRTLLEGGVGGWVPSEVYSRKLPQNELKFCTKNTFDNTWFLVSTVILY